MKILFVHSGILPVRKYGGTERIIFWHMKELVRLGHEVYLIGHPQSAVSEYGIHLIPQEGLDWRNQIPKGIDLAHLFFTSSFSVDIPILVTIEGNGKPGEKFHPNTIFISKSHALNHGSGQFVYNGIDLSEYPFSGNKRKKWDNFLFLAKAKWKIKNLADCIEVCKTAQKHLQIAGGRKWTFSRFIHSHGMVDQERKLKLLQSSDALLFPVRWPEPFGIAVIEAFAMGLPVIGSSYGSLPELIQPNVGILCKTYQDLQRSVALGENVFNSEEIRSYVETHFSINKMSLRYIALYQQILEGKPIHQKQPQAQFNAPADTLLPF